MSQKLSLKQTIVVGTMLFGMFFGAGNLIFPIHLGQLAGNQYGLATIGFMITAVGLPLLGILALALSASDGIFALASYVGPRFAKAFTILLYLTIGPMFALPRLAAVSFEVAIGPYVTQNSLIYLLIFSILFYGIALYLSLSKTSIMTIVGKIITPAFLVLLVTLLAFVLLYPLGSPNQLEAVAPYNATPLFSSFVDGYQTMDALAALAFGIVVVDTLKDLGVQNTKTISWELFKSGVVASLLMFVLYAGLMHIGATSRAHFGIHENGGVALAQVVIFYFRRFGHVVVAAIITLGCLKTAIGLITASSRTFNELSNDKVSRRTFAVLVTVVSAGVAVFGLSALIQFAVPMLMFIYPLTIALIILGMLSPLLPKYTSVYKSVILFTLIASIGDLLVSLPKSIQSAKGIATLIEGYSQFLPFYKLQLGWVLCVIVGLVIGFIYDAITHKKYRSTAQ